MHFPDVSEHSARQSPHTSLIFKKLESFSVNDKTIQMVTRKLTKNLSTFNELS